MNSLRRSPLLNRFPFRPAGVPEFPLLFCSLPLLPPDVSRGLFAGENHLDKASGRMLDTRDRTLLMIELLGSSSKLLSVLVLSAAPLAAAAVVAAIGGDDDGLPSLLLVILE